MSIEASMWRYLQKKLPPRAHVVRVENRTGPGTPDVYVCHHGKSVWLELKTLNGWPVRPQTIVRVDHYTAHQKLWGEAHWKAGGDSYVLLKVCQDWLLFTARLAGMYLGQAPKFRLADIATKCWWGKLNADELNWFLFERE